jgi:soluble lytic murein transglycosylase
MTKTRLITLAVLLILVITACTSPVEQPPVDPPISPAPTNTATPAPTPTTTATLPPAPEVSLTDGEFALFVGDYQSALSFFQDAVSRSDDQDIKAQAQFGLGQAYFIQDEISVALNHFRQAATTADPVTASRAQYMLGHTYTRLQRYEEALDAYQAFLDLRPGLIDSRLHELRGDLFTTLGDHQTARTSYQQAYLTEPNGGSDALAVKVARSYQVSGDEETALSLFRDIYSRTTNDYTKAQMALLIGRILLDQGQPDQAYAILQESVEQFPFAFDAYTALVILVDDGVPVDEYQRGLVNYSMGNHLLAIEAFDRYLSQEPVEMADAALYHKALATRALGGAERHQAAVALWEELIDSYPTSSYYVDAWQSIEFTLWAFLGDHQAAARTSLDFVAQRPENPNAPDFLFRAGRAYERGEMLQEAADTWARVAGEYPESSEAFQTTYFAGIARIRLGDWAGAQVLFSRALVLTTEPSELAAAHLWIGKCQEAQGEIADALDSWKIAQTANPFGHYSIRAEDLLIGREPFSEPAVYTLDPDLSPYLPEAEAWLRTTFDLPAEINLESPGMLAYDPRFQRGLEYWALGDYPAGKAEFDAIRLEFSQDPAQTFRLIPTLVEIGLYRSALVASTQLLRLAGLERGDALSAPEYFSRVRFGAYYLDLVMLAAESRGISPMMILSVMRQESTYEGFIRSGAGARGLMQIMPATGEEIARNLGWPDEYTVQDLDRPYISITFGASYLRQQRNLFEGDTFSMLSAYNGGPGNTIAWRNMTPIDDPDLFLEIIRFEETRTYIRIINEIHYIYGWLYGEPEER